MKINYYDTFSQLIVGCILLFEIMYVLDITPNNTYAIPYLAMACVVGYFINTLGSLLDRIYYFNGKPSSILLKVNSTLEYTGTKKVRFYEAKVTLEKLKKRAGVVDKISEAHLYSLAKRVVGYKLDARIQMFNEQYIFSRSILTLSIISLFIAMYEFGLPSLSEYNNVSTLYICLLLAIAISWHRFIQRSFYYAREILKEYLNTEEH